jgi:colicin import membrane protein
MDPLRPRRPGGMGRGAAIAIGVHVLLLIALAVGVNWRTSEPQNVTAELWAAVPETAAPALVAPPTPPPPKPVEKVVEPPPQPAKPEPPPPREADIALEKEKEKLRLKTLAEEEKEKAEALKKKKELAAKQKEEEAQRQAQAQAQAEAAQTAQREANLKRLQGLAGATGAPTATGTGQRDAGPKGGYSAGYAARIISRVKPNIVMSEVVEGSPRALVEVRAAPDGTILSRRLVKSSGDKSWDEAVLRAIDRTGVLPRDADGTVPSPIEIGFTPN